MLKNHVERRINSPSNDCGVSNAHAARDHHVHLTRHVGWYLARVVGERRELCRGLVDIGAEHGARWCSRVLELELLIGLDHGSGQLDGWECLNVQVGASWARLDELSGKREDGTWAKRGVEGSGDGHRGGERANVRLMAGLDCDDGGGDTKDGGRVDEWSSTEVSRDTSGFKDTGGGNHALCVRETEVVLALLHRRATSLRDGGGESRDVRRLGLASLLQGIDLWLLETKRHEV